MATDSSRLRALHRVGVLALASLGGAVIGLMGSFTHQSLPPVGLAIALITVGLYTTGLRAWGADRGPALAGGVGISAVALGLATPGAGASVVIPANLLGYGWSLGLMLVAMVVLVWPRVQRPPHRPAGSIEVPESAPTSSVPADERDPTAP